MPTMQPTQGQDFRSDLAVKQDDGVTAYDLSGCTLWFTLKRAFGDADLDAELQHKTGVGTGLLVTNAPGGLATHTISATETAGLAVGLLYRYDYKLKAADGTLKPIEAGTLSVKPYVTRATS
jgi:hypothetical protein